MYWKPEGLSPKEILERQAQHAVSQAQECQKSLAALNKECAERIADIDVWMKYAAEFKAAASKL